MKLVINTKRQNWRKKKSALYHGAVQLAIGFCLLVLLWLLGGIIKDAIGWLNWSFLTGFPSRTPEKSGMLPGIIGSFILIVITAFLTIPIGIGAAIYMEEYANKQSRLYKMIDLSISNLAGVPSIIYGIIGLSLFSYMTLLRGTILSGGITLAMLVLPLVIVSSQEAIKSVPRSMTEAAYALGLTKLQTIRCVVLPVALPGMMTGVILGLSRAIGEGAPLIVVGAATILNKLPTSLGSTYTAMPIQIFYWSGLPKAEFQNVAAAGGVVLVVVLLVLNSLAIIIRNKYQKQNYYK